MESIFCREFERRPSLFEIDFVMLNISRMTRPAVAKVLKQLLWRTVNLRRVLGHPFRDACICFWELLPACLDKIIHLLITFTDFKI